MPARVTCPACQTTLAVNAAGGNGTVLRCPQCRHEFAVRLRSAPPETPTPLVWPPNDPLAQLPAALSPVTPRHQLRPNRSRASRGPSGSSMLWIGVGAGAALPVALVVLVAIFLRLSSPAADHQDLTAIVSPPTPGSDQPYGPPPSDLATNTSLTTGASPETMAARAATSPSASTAVVAPARSLPVWSVDPSLLNSLGPEVAVGPYRLRLPHGMQPLRHSDYQFGLQSWSWIGPEDAQRKRGTIFVSIVDAPQEEVGQYQDIDRELEDSPKITVDGRLVEAAPSKKGLLMGKTFVRKSSHFGTSPWVAFIGNDGTRHITLRFISPEPEGTQTYELLEASLLSIR